LSLKSGLHSYAGTTLLTYMINLSPGGHPEPGLSEARPTRLVLHRMDPQNAGRAVQEFLYPLQRRKSYKLISALSPLGMPDFRILFIARTVSMIGDQFSYIALPFAVLMLTHSPRLVGIALGARLVPYVAFLLVGGVYSDKIPRNTILVLANGLCGACQLLLGTIILTGAADIALVIVLNMIYGFASSFLKPSYSGIIQDIVGQNQVGAANALVAISLSAGNIAGPVIGGILVAVAGAGWAINFDGASFIACSTLIIFTRKILATSSQNSKTSFMRDLAEGWRVVRTRVWLWCSIAYFGVFQFVVLGSFFVIGPLVAERSLGGASAWGTLITCSGIGGLLGGFLALRFRPSRLLVGMYIALFGVTPVLFAMAASAPFWALVVATLVWGAAFEYGGTLWETAMLQYIPRHAISRAIAYDSMVSTALQPLGLAVFGQLAATAGTSLPLTLAGAGTLVLTLGILLIPDVRKGAYT
jgi:MFS family permease